MHFLIYGAGALGQAVGCMLAAAGHQVDLVLRERFKTILGQQGLEVTGIFGDYRVGPEQLGLFTGLAEISQSDHDYLLLTTKTYDTPSAIAAITGLSGFAGQVVSLQNGCGNIEQLEAAFGPERTLGGRVITGFEIDCPGTVRITVSADDVHLGGCQPGAVPLAAVRLATAINQAGLPCRAVEDIHQDLFAKLLYNCALNPLGAVLAVHYGALGEHPESRRVMNQVIEETFAVIAAMGRTTPWKDPAAYRRVFYEQLIPVTYNHRASMLQDIENNKPTEVDALVGYVAAKGEEHNIATPTCSTLAALVRFKEQGAVPGSGGAGGC
ncbi:ketopantoate reductase family protein [Desulfogranum mediterraneum]|uniref:ketopantoate reductase family protein n=1 Tax=Desulfogranum mediterraneum TaxID=160661 RepID=UPI00040C2FD3|nr:2-dehydropantoate 2-reductase [Desulfogranum mediterraneum]